MIAPDDPRLEDVRAVLERHLAFARATSPPEHVHALDLEGLVDPTVVFFSARDERTVVAVGAIRRLDDAHAELKSMHTLEEVRGRGIGRAMLDHLLGYARAQGYRQVSLETGTMEEFAPARALYAQAGFEPCAPFGRYTVNPYSTCMTLRLAPRS
ncbi:MAG TPA: GNAT family N-acetyltransferase [Acidimicrobiales bacterium]|nr:GNAT family N-acetyltransferase [Acidimicrobiales bacterium]